MEIEGQNSSHLIFETGEALSEENIKEKERKECNKRIYQPLSRKMKDLGSFTISIALGNLRVHNALLNLGVNINDAICSSVWKEIDAISLEGDLPRNGSGIDGERCVVWCKV